MDSTLFMPKVALFLLLLPLLELFTLIGLASVVGFWITVLWIFATGIWGAWLIKIAGPSAINRARRDAARQGGTGQLDGMSLLGNWFGGVMLLIPGLLTDILGLFMVVPILRDLTVGVWLRKRVQEAVAQQQKAGRAHGSVYEGEVVRRPDQEKGRVIEADPSSDHDDDNRSDR